MYKGKNFIHFVSIFKISIAHFSGDFSSKSPSLKKTLHHFYVLFQKVTFNCIVLFTVKPHYSQFFLQNTKMPFFSEKITKLSFFVQHPEFRIFLIKKNSFSQTFIYRLNFNQYLSHLHGFFPPTISKIPFFYPFFT